MRFWHIFIFTVLIATPALADLPCGTLEGFRSALSSPRYLETERDTWEVEKLTFHYYRNDINGNWTVFFSYEAGDGGTIACIVAYGRGARGQEL